MDKNDAYKQTKGEPKELVDVLKKRFLVFPPSLSAVQSVKFSTKNCCLQYDLIKDCKSLFSEHFLVQAQT